MHNMLHALFGLPGTTGSIVTWRKGRPATYTPSQQPGIQAQYEGKTDWYFGQTPQDQAKAGKRSTNNGALSIGHLWADIDRSDKDGKYPTVEEAVVMLKSLPFTPSILVDSGGGFHAYWLLDRPYDAQENLNICKRFQLLLVKYLQKVNPNKTIDATGDLARVLRIPGTINSKADKPVKILAMGDVRYSLSEIKDQLNKEGIGDKSNGRSKQSTNSILKAMGSLDTKQSEPVSIHDISQECPQIKSLIDTGGQSASEPLWYTSLGVAAYTEEGEDAAHLMSKNHGGYDQDLTITKMHQWKDASDGPPTCDRFKEVNPNGCLGCPHSGIITTPVQLEASQKITIDASELNLSQPTFIIPRPFSIDTDKKLKVLVDVDDAGKKTYATIFDGEILPVARIWDEQDHQEYVTFTAHLPKDGWRECEFPTAVLADQNGALKAMAAVGVAIQPDMHRWFTRYIIACVNAMQKGEVAQMAHSVMGWQDDNSFVLKDKRFTKTGTVVPGHLSPSHADSLASVVTKGTKDGWIRAFEVLCGKAVLAPFTFAAFTAFAAPLVKALDFPGFIYHMYSSKSGIGKSYYLKVISSVYGKPLDNTILLRDSEKAKYKTITARCDIPTVFDEITNIDPKELSDFCYSVSQGRMHNRLNQDSTLRKNKDYWRTILVTSGNKSLHDSLFAHRQTAFGEAMRVVEVEVSLGQDVENQPFTSTEAHGLMEMFNKNYGVIGEEWLKYVTANRKLLFEQVNEAYTLINKEGGIKPAARFWSALVAMIWVAAVHTRSLGYHPLDISFFRSYGLRLLDNLQGDVKDRKLAIEPMTVLRDFIITNVAAKAFVESNKGVVLRTPKDDIYMRVDAKRGRIAIRAERFNEYCIKKSVDIGTVTHDLRKRGIMDPGTKSARLGKGEFGTNSIRCYIINDQIFQEMDSLREEVETKI